MKRMGNLLGPAQQLVQQRLAPRLRQHDEDRVEIVEKPRAPGARGGRRRIPVAVRIPTARVVVEAQRERGGNPRCAQHDAFELVPPEAP